MLRSFLIILLALYGVSGAPLTWEKLYDETNTNFTGPSEREGHAFGYSRKSNVLIVFSGRSGNNIMNDTWLFNLTTQMWRQVVTPTALKGRFYSYFGVIEKYNIFVVSHGIASTTEYKDVWAFSFANETWYSVIITGGGPNERYGGHFGAYWDTDSDSLFLGGGFTSVTLLPERYIDVYRLQFSDATAATWHILHSNPTPANQFNPLVPHGRCLQASTIVQSNKLVMFGGCLSNSFTEGGIAGGPCPAEDTWSYDAASKEWRQLSLCPQARVWAAMAPLTDREGYAVLHGGNGRHGPQQIISTTDYPEEELYAVNVNAPTGEEWIRLKTEGPSDEFPQQRFRHTMIGGENGTLYLFGGLSLDMKTTFKDLWVLNGRIEDSERMDTTCNRVWFSYLHLHGLLMALAWGILLPLGALIARYYKNYNSKIWLILHVSLQIFGVIITVTGFVVIFIATSPIPSHPHAIIGVILMVIALQQPINGILRPHLKKDRRDKKTKRRICWEIFHRMTGVFAILIGFAQITLGVFLIIAPLGVWAFWVAFLGLWIIIFVIHEVIMWIRHCIGEDDDHLDGDYPLKEKRRNHY